MALTSSTKFGKLARFSLTTADAGALASFYIQAFGCRRIGDDRPHGDAFRNLMGVESDARRITLALGSEIIELLEFDQPGAPYPADANASGLVFQHFAIVTNDMTAAWLSLLRTNGWSHITSGNPQRLPASSGSVTAFKFRDPEGHPLELLSFPRDHMPVEWRGGHGARPCLGIDHSAMSISNTARSTAFYTAHGLCASGCSRNAGVEQDQLDGIADASVEVTALSPALPTPHVELLCYEQTAAASPLWLASNDIAATRLVFESHDVAAPVRIPDPDRHHLIVMPYSDLQEAA